MSEYRHEKECPSHEATPANCKNCKLILIGYVKGLRDGRRAAATAVRNAMPTDAKDEFYTFAMDVIRAAEGK